MTSETFNTMKDRMAAKINDIPLPSLKINVFGSINLNIHVTCEGRTTAEKWNAILHKFCRKVSLCETIIYNKENQGTCLLPSRRKAFRVAAVV